jgi:hypothetical protein
VDGGSVTSPETDHTGKAKTSSIDLSPLTALVEEMLAEATRFVEVAAEQESAAVKHCQQRIAAAIVRCASQLAAVLATIQKQETP